MGSLQCSIPATAPFLGSLHATMYLHSQTCRVTQTYLLCFTTRGSFDELFRAPGLSSAKVLNMIIVALFVVEIALKFAAYTCKGGFDSPPESSHRAPIHSSRQRPSPIEAQAEDPTTPNPESQTELSPDLFTPSAP